MKKKKLFSNTTTILLLILSAATSVVAQIELPVFDDGFRYNLKPFSMTQQGDTALRYEMGVTTFYEGSPLYTRPPFLELGNQGVMTSIGAIEHRPGPVLLIFYTEEGKKYRARLVLDSNHFLVFTGRDIMDQKNLAK